MPNLAFTVGNLTGSIHFVSGQDEITLSDSAVIGFYPALIDNEKAIVMLPERFAKCQPVSGWGAR
jgi:hypothetical protein